MNRPHYKLNVWKKSIQFVKDIYSSTTDFPSEEKFSLVSQMRRAAVSIPSNIAEGAARKSSKVFNNFLSIALGSASELETQIIISNELGFFEQDQSDSMLNKLEDISKMIIGLQQPLK